MFRKSLLALVATLSAAAMLATVPARAADLSVEDPGWRPAPAAIARLINAVASNADTPQCAPYLVHQLPGAPNMFVLTSSAACWGSAAAPLWFVTTGAEPKLLFSDGGMGIHTRPARAGTPTIVITAANAGTCTERTWRYARGRYRAGRTGNCL